MEEDARRRRPLVGGLRFPPPVLPRSPWQKERDFFKWMRLYFSKLQRTRTKCARYFILLACFLCSALPPCSASAEENYWQGFIDLYNQLSHMEGVMGDIRSNQDFWYPIMAGVSNPPSAGDLNNNPWWATNSAFALTQYNYERIFPNEQPNLYGTFSFPQFASKWSSFLTAPRTTPGPATAEQIAPVWFNRYFGYVRRESYDQANPYTWFDWIADFNRSNMIANSAINTNELAQWAIQSGADYVEEFKGSTNAVAIGRNITNSLDEVMDTFDDELSHTGENESSSLLNSFDFEGWLDFPTTGRDPQLLIFPESTIGGVHVDAVVGSIALPQSVSSWVSLVAAWLYRVILFVMLFSLVKGEYTYWTSLGHTEAAA